MGVEMGKHWIPQAYLRAFATSQDPLQIHMYDKSARRWTRAAIKKVAQDSEYFSQETEERLAREVEGPAHVALAKLREGHWLTEDEGGDLLRYIAVMILRVPRHREFARKLIPQTITSVFEKNRTELAALRSPSNERRVLAILRELERLEPLYQAAPDEMLKHELRTPWPSDVINGAIFSMAWRLIRVPRSCPLLTSDNPAFYFSGYGLGGEESELTFVIDQGLVLLGSRQGVPGSLHELEAKRPLAKEINRRVIVGADRFVFSAFPYGWVGTVAKKGEPDLNRIIW